MFSRTKYTQEQNPDYFCDEEELTSMNDFRTSMQNE